MDRAGDFASGHVGRASLPEGAALAVLLTCAVADGPVVIDACARRAEVAIGSLQAIATGTDVAVVFMVIDEVGALEAAIVPGGLVEHGDVRLDALVLDQPGQVGGRPVGPSATSRSGQM